MTRVERAANHIKDRLSGKAVLEVACGCAEFSLCAAKLAGTVVCIDLDFFRLDPRVQDCESITFRQMDATAMRFADETFDTVVMYNAVGHLEGILEKVLRECQRVLRPGGCIQVISSFQLDKLVIDSALLPLLSASGTDHVKERDQIFTYVRIEKRGQRS